MKKGFYAVLTLCVGMMFFATGCHEKKPVAADTTNVVTADSDTIEVVQDSVAELMAEQPIPKAADELFDDFIYLFCHNRQHQMGRIQWPLKEVSGSKVKLVQPKQWQMEQLYIPQGYYTLILDNRKQLQLSKDTSISHVVVEKIFMDHQAVRKFNFDRVEGQWMLTSVENGAVVSNQNASFLQFYEKFAADSAFQAESLADQMSFSGPDPDDDSHDIQTEITPEDWPYYTPGELPQGVLFNIIYGQKYQVSNRKVFLLRGIANGQEMEMNFQQVGGEWKLTGLKV